MAVEWCKFERTVHSLQPGDKLDQMSEDLLYEGEVIDILRYGIIVKLADDIGSGNLAGLVHNSSIPGSYKPSDYSKGTEVAVSWNGETDENDEQPNLEIFTAPDGSRVDPEAEHVRTVADEVEENIDELSEYIEQGGAEEREAIEVFVEDINDELDNLELEVVDPEEQEEQSDELPGDIEVAKKDDIDNLRARMIDIRQNTEKLLEAAEEQEAAESEHTGEGVPLYFTQDEIKTLIQDGPNEIPDLILEKVVDANDSS